MKTICLYSELDAFSGYIKHDIKDIAKLISDLKLACLFYDQVIVNTPVFIEHPLTLPAFEILSPFVQSGMLWTSTKNTQEQPFDFLSNRMINTFYESNNKHLSVSINKTLDRWGNIVPDSWMLFRNANAQINDATSNIIKNLSALETLKSESAYKQTILDILYKMKSENIFNRDYMLAKVASMQDELSQSTINNISLLIQSEYINQGVHNKGNPIVLFPGYFVRKTNRTKLLKNYLPIDLFTLPTAIKRFREIGYPLKGFLNIPVNTLFFLASSENWINWRRNLLSEHWNKENSIEMMSLFKHKVPFHKAIKIQYQNIKPSPISISPKWQLLGKSGLGIVSQLNSNHEFTLDLQSRVLCLKNKAITLNKASLNLISILISSGDKGIHTEQIKFFDIEKRFIVSSNNNFNTQHKKNYVLDKSVLNRIYVLKNRINKKIFPLEVIIGNSVWKLKIPDGEAISIKNSAWTGKEKEKVIFDSHSEPKLSSKNKLLLSLLKKKSPHFLHTKTIILELKIKTSNEEKKVSDAIYRLEKKLSDSSYLIIKDYNGGYALIVK